MPPPPTHLLRLSIAGIDNYQTITHVMTRDSYRVHDDRGSHQDDADIFAALSRTGSFARLPEDAPPELKDITVEIEDPKRVYTVYRAGRRHNFQLLVERYYLVLRFI